jgi:alanyl-tRNA synthetase
VLQHVHSNYEIDLFQALIKAAAELTGTADLAEKSLRVIADHIRACSFLIVDGVLPSNEGRGYVLRRIIRRALRHGWMLGTKGLFFHRMVAPLVEQMGGAYPELVARQSMVEAALKAEEERFAETLDQGMKVFAEVAARTQGIIAGEEVFRLYDTYGFPADLTADVARERGLSIDMAGFEQSMEGQRERARAASQFGGAVALPGELIQALAPTGFEGYHAPELAGARVVGIVADGRSVQRLAAGARGTVLLDRTPFYAESGGQVGDTGVLAGAGGRFTVEDTHKLAGAFHGHIGTAQGTIAVGDLVHASIDADRRGAIVLNHSATHLLHAALRHVLGEHVQQKGSLVAPDRLRFDFSHFQPLTAAELARIEELVNVQVRRNAAAAAEEMAYQAAIDAGAMALFGEKYGERVRVLRMGGFSTELCGGTHVERTGDIGLFKIVAESGVAAGVRRIEAVTGAGALQVIAAREHTLGEVGKLLGAPSAEVIERLRAVFERQKQIERELESLKARAANAALDGLLSTAPMVGDVRVLAARIDGLDAKALRDGVDRVRQALGNAVVVLASGVDGKVALVAGVGGTAQGRVKAGELLSQIAAQIGGKGGGRPDLAQGGGEDSPKVAQALGGVADWVAAKLG